MISRRLFASFFLALALLLGQQAAALHQLAHASEQRSEKAPGSPVKQACDQCFLGAPLAGAVGAFVSIPPVVLAGGILALARLDTSALPAPRLPFRSRAPPALS